jgi:hypothetical protein
MAAKKAEVHLRLSNAEFDLLCRFARDNGDLSLNGAVKLLLFHVRRGTIDSSGTIISPTPCANTKVN